MEETLDRKEQVRAHTMFLLALFFELAVKSSFLVHLWIDNPRTESSHSASRSEVEVL